MTQHSPPQPPPPPPPSPSPALQGRRLWRNSLAIYPLVAAAVTIAKGPVPWSAPICVFSCERKLLQFTVNAHGMLSNSPTIRVGRSQYCSTGQLRERYAWGVQCNGCGGSCDGYNGSMLERNGGLKLLLRIAGAALVGQAFLMYCTSGKQLYVLRPQLDPPTDQHMCSLVPPRLRVGWVADT